MHATPPNLRWISLLPRRSLPGWALLIAMALLLGLPYPVRAASIVVDTLADEVIVDGNCSLREAIQAANDNVAVDACPAGEAGNPDEISFAVSGTITLTAQLEVTAGGPLVIHGANAIEVSGVGIAGGYGFRLMFINPGAVVTLEDLALSNGFAGLGGGAFYNGGTLAISSSTISGNYASAGGGIYNDGTLAIADSTISGNYGDNSGGGVYNAGTMEVTGGNFSGNDAGSGGAIRNAGTLTIRDSTISGNHAYSGGGGISNAYITGMLTLMNSTVSGNGAEVYGGGIDSDGTLEMINSRVAANRSNTFAGGISNGGTLHMTSSEVTGNTSYRVTGGIDNTGVMVIGDSTVSDNWGWIIAGGIRNGGTLTIEGNSTVSDNDGTDAGGGILNNGTLTITQSTVSGGAYKGGGILNTGTLTISEATLTGGADEGGGILNVGTLVLSESTLTGSVARQGGGLLNTTSIETPYGYSWSGPGMATLSNSTVSGNTAPNGVGGGVLNSATLDVTNSTFFGNSSSVDGGILNDGTLTFRNTIVANSTGVNCTNNGGLVDGGGNLSWPDATCPGLNADPLLGPLADNGGPTQTHALLPGSPAIDAALLANCPPTDQRGVIRPQGPGCDIGAFELEDTTAPTITITTPADGATYLLGQAVAADYTCQDEAGGSGLAACVGPVPDGSPIDTGSVGAKTFTVQATDNTGNPASLTHHYTVVYNFTGFFTPVDNLPTFNVVRAGAAVPLKFRLGGEQGLDIFAPGYPISKRIACGSAAPQDDIERTVTAGSSSVSYNAASDTYTYVWKTGNAWAGTCRQLIVRLNDGSVHKANFRFTR